LVTITGSNLLSIQSVRFAGVEAEFYPYIETEFSARVPYAPSGPIAVVTAGGTAISDQDFTIIGAPPPPRVLGFSPTNGIGGTLVTILATNLGTVDKVLFDKTEADFTSSAEGLVAVVPPFATSGPISVETAPGTVVTRDVFTTYNSGDLGLLNAVSASPVIVGTRVVFSIVLTNLNSTTLDKVVVTNSFAAGGPASGGIVSGQRGLAVFTNVVPADVTISSVSTSQGSYALANGSVIWQIGSLESTGSVRLTVEIQATTPQVVHLLSVATGKGAASKDAYASSLASVVMTGSLHLTARHLNQDSIEVSWPMVDPPLILQRAEAPVRTALWTDVTKPVTVRDGNNVVVLLVGSEYQFFRLVNGKR
jgi:hypothetical protein